MAEADYPVYPERVDGTDAAESPEYMATRVRIGRRLRSLTKAGQVRISGGRLRLLTSYGSEIDSAPVQAVRAGRAWFTGGEQASAEVNGTRYLLKLDADSVNDGDGADTADSSAGAGGTARPATRRFIEAVRRARAR